MYTTHATETLKLVKVESYLGDLTTTAKYGKLRLTIKNSAGIPKVYSLCNFSSPGGKGELQNSDGYLVIPPKSDIKFQAIASAAGEAIVWAIFERVPTI
jgi:hypothetical protein